MIYLAGKITDTTPEKTAENKLRFYAKAQELRLMGVKVFNPVEHEMEGETWEKLLASDLHAIFTKKISGIYLMKGWEESQGARLELEACRLLARNNSKFEIIKEQ